ncbi:MAG: type II toxin-antitoxin system VapB family antitoxin [Lautropia sp.]|nr:type II toxin-antitoxin system VapB family antitoxin [Lautropia sp.]
MEQASVFKSNQSQAIRLPKAVALPDHIRKVDVIAVGNTRLITPAGQAWDAWFDAEGVSDDFMNERDQPEHQVRESF